MYSIIPFETPKDNIYEIRNKQIENVETITRNILASTGFSLFKSGKVEVLDPTAQTLCRTLTAEQVGVVEDGARKKISIKIPLYENGSYLINGNRYIPIFQISDIPIFNKNENTLLVHNTYCTLVFDKQITEFRISTNTWPLLLLMLYLYGDEFVRNEPHIHLSMGALDGCVSLKFEKSLYINFEKDHFKDLLLPFNDLERIKQFEDAQAKYSLDDDNAYKHVLKSWNKASKLDKILNVLDTVDYIMVPNGIFDNPYSMKDMVKYLYEHRQDYQNMPIREINDISQRRARLSEWICYKLAQQHKINKKTKSSSMFSDALIGVLTLDQRRILDDSVNPLGELCMFSRIIYNGPGGIAKESCSALVRNLHESYRGIIDPIDSPSGPAIGICQHLVPDCGFENGILKPSKSGSILSTASQLIPLLCHDDGIRIEMGCNQQRQAVNIAHPEIPLIKTGNESLYTEYTSSLKLAKDSGQVIYKDNSLLIVKYDTLDDEVIDISNKAFTDFDKTLLTNLNEGDKFCKGATLAHTNNINPYTHELMLGKNLLVGFMSLDGWNFEDAIVVSESCAKKMAYRCNHIEKIKLNNDCLFDLGVSDEYTPFPNDGTIVNKGDVLFKLGNVDTESLAGLTPTIEEVLAPISGKFTSKVFIKNSVSENTQMSAWLKKQISERQKIEDKIKNAFSYLKDPQKYTEMYCYLDKIKKIDDDTGVIEYSIYNEKPLTVGSKISNRHGNKGTISIILPDEKMPTLPDGRHLDVVLNPLGVITRMNVGQLYELHMTWFMDQYIKQHYNDSKDDFIKAIMKFVDIVDCTENKVYTKQIKELLQFDDTIEDIKEHGLQIIQEPFRCCNINQLEQLRQLVGVDYETNVVYNNHSYKCSVGWMYMLHLHHEPDHKIFGRSLGAYGKHNQPPSGASSHRLGEMENWALQAYEAFDTQKEFMSIKSDNPKERVRLWEYLYDGISETYQPISLDTVTKDTFKTTMNGAGLDVEF